MSPKTSNNDGDGHEPPTPRLRLMIAEDLRLYPMTQVLDLDTRRVRLIRLPPREAVMFALASDEGNTEWYLEYKDRVTYSKGEWICGRYHAPDRLQ